MILRRTLLSGGATLIASRALAQFPIPYSFSPVYNVANGGGGGGGGGCSAAFPVINETQNALDFSKSIIEIDLALGVLQGDIVEVGVDTNNGAQVSAVRAGADFTASVGNGTNVLAVSAVANGIICVGQLLSDAISGAHIPQGTTITGQTSGSAGGTGNYSLSSAIPAGAVSESMQTADPNLGARFSGSISGMVLTVASVSAGVVGIGQWIVDDFFSVVPGTKITSLGSGAGGAGTYNLNISQTVATASMRAAGLARIAVGFSLSVWEGAALANLAGYPPAQSILLNYSSSYNTTSVIAVNVRGVVEPDPDPSLPAVQTGNPSPPTATFSTSKNKDLALFWIGCAVGFAGVAPWTNPIITGVNTTVPANTWTWVNGLNNTGLLQPIALALYSAKFASSGSSSASTTASMQGAAYIVTALSGCS